MLILVTGLPGSGKTTFAESLAHNLGARHLSSDQLRSHLGKKGRYDSESKKAVYCEMLRQAEQLLQNREKVIIDATFFKESLRQPFILLAERLKEPVFWVELIAAEATIKERIQKKRQDSEADFSVYQKVKSDWEPLAVDHLCLWSDKQTSEEMLSLTGIYLQSEEINPVY